MVKSNSSQPDFMASLAIPSSKHYTKQTTTATSQYWKHKIKIDKH